MASSNALMAYRALLRAASPLLSSYTAYQSCAHGGARYFWQRHGQRFPRRDDRPAWFHCASVGEVAAAAPLIWRWCERMPDKPMIVSTTTATGADNAARLLPPTVGHVYLPLDWPAAVRRFLERVDPRCALILETELWPNLYRACAARATPLIIVNGRLSRRTTRAWAWVKSAYHGALQDVSAVLARSDADRQRFIALGAPADKVETTGNIKFAPPVSRHAQSAPDLIGMPYWLAASTHDDEELRLARMILSLTDSGYLPVIAPRHPKRRENILKQLGSLGVKVTVRSRNDQISDGTQIYLADTLGEMPALMTHAALVFMGGSLIPAGGHNVLEPARLGKAIVVGPHTEGVADEVHELEAAGALREVANDEELLQVVQELLAKPGACQVMGNHARQVMAENSDMADRYLDRIVEICGLGPETSF